MPSTYTYQAAIDHAKFFVKNMPVTNVQLVICDYINSLMWTVYPWKWALNTLTPILLVDGTQDYSSAPSDFMTLYRARITRTDVTPNENNDILVQRWIPPDLVTRRGYSAISSICYEQSLNKFRISSSAQIPSGVTAYINGEYRKTPTKVNSLAQVIPFPDHYFPVLVAGVIWQIYRFADDPRSGAPVATKSGQVQYSGAMGEFFDNLMVMRESEDMGTAGQTMWPEESMGAYRPGFPGLFGV